MKINVNKLSYKYDTNQNFSLNDVSTSIHSGEFIAIIGHTGSGKSTFIQNLNGLLIPTNGSITIDEYVIKSNIKLKNIKEIRKKIGIVFQFPEYQLFQETVEKDILFGPKNFNLNEDSLNNLASKMLNVVGLDDSYLNKSPFELSGGEKRKVAIAGILAFNPDILIVDEPTAGLDPLAAKNMMDLFKKLNEMGKTIIFVTHQMDHVLEYANRVLVFHNGHLVCDKKPLELFNDTKLVNELEIDVANIIKLVNLVAIKHPRIKNYQIKTINDFINAYKEVISL